MKKQLLMIAPRIPSDTGSSFDKKIEEHLNTFSAVYDIFFLYIQTLTANEEALKRLKEKGVSVISREDIKISAKSYDYIDSLLSETKFDLCLITNALAAKYYIPYMLKYATSGVIAIDASDSRYAFNMKAASQPVPDAKRALYLKNAEMNWKREIPIYAHADVVITPDESYTKILSEELPALYVTHDMSDFLTELKVNKNRLPDTVELENRIHYKVIDSVLPRVPEHIQKEYLFIATESTLVPEESIKRMLFCAESHPRVGIVFPSSNINMGGVQYEGLNDFIPKHYKANLGNWDEIKDLGQALATCILVKKEILDKIGYFDRRYRTPVMAFYDLCMRAYQSGFKALTACDAFVFEKKKNEFISAALSCYERDLELLYEKWCRKSTEFIEQNHG